MSGSAAASANDTGSSTLAEVGASISEFCSDVAESVYEVCSEVAKSIMSSNAGEDRVSCVRATSTRGP